MEYTERQECPYTGCKAPARTSGVVKAGTLGCDEAHAAGGKFGTKLRQIVERIQDIPKEDRIIVFVQFSDLMKVKMIKKNSKCLGFPEIILKMTYG